MNIKSYTDLEQSHKLAEILPTESADMEYLAIKENGALVGAVPFVKDDSEVEDSAYNYTYNRIPCWSLAGLLGILPTMIGGEFDEVLQLKMDKHLINFHLWYISLDTDKVKEGLDIVELNPVDACVAMIKKLHELNLL